MKSPFAISPKAIPFRTEVLMEILYTSPHWIADGFNGEVKPKRIGIPESLEVRVQKSIYVFGFCCYRSVTRPFCVHDMYTDFWKEVEALQAGIVTIFPWANSKLEEVIVNIRKHEKGSEHVRIRTVIAK